MPYGYFAGLIVRPSLADKGRLPVRLLTGTGKEAIKIWNVPGAPIQPLQMPWQAGRG